MVARELEALENEPFTPLPDDPDMPPYPQAFRDMIPPWLTAGILVRATQDFEVHRFFRIPTGSVLTVAEVTCHQTTTVEEGHVHLSLPDDDRVFLTDIPLVQFAHFFQPVEGEGGLPARRPRFPNDGRRIMGVDPYVAVQEDTRSASASMRPALPDWLTPGATVICHTATAVPPLGVLAVGTAGVVTEVRWSTVVLFVGSDAWTVSTALMAAHWHPAGTTGPEPVPPAPTAHERLLDDESV